MASSTNQSHATTAVVIAGTAVAVAVGGYALYRFYNSDEQDSSNAGKKIVSLDPQSIPDVVKRNQHLFPQEYPLLQSLLDEGQGHLFEAWAKPGTSAADKKHLVKQLANLDASYHGGLIAYIRNAKKLLQDSKEGRNPFDGYTPSVPHGEKLDFASEEYLQLEEAGLVQAGQTAFVLVAGGLGERLGYSGIKVALPCESATGTCFLQLYAQYILALQSRSGSGRKLPFAIMTSDDTQAQTLGLLQKHKYFGLEPSQVTLVKQEKVACLTDNDAHLALDPKEPFQVQTKPHGHGDVHALMHSSGLVKKWKQEGFKWVCFFQDTNALVFRALVAALGVSAKHDYDMNSLAVPRKAKEAIGAIAKLDHKDGSSLTINVEYNQLDPLLRSTINKDGDVNDSSGFSPFPGNINQLVLKISTYEQQLQQTGGIISEFVNPKYKDASKTEFKSSTRLECMMQDYPKALPPGAKVGFTTIKQVWASYSPVKNSAADALAKFKEGNPTHSATTGELDIYKANCQLLRMLTDAHLPKPEAATFNGIDVELYARVVLSPSFAPVLADAKAKIKPGSLTLERGAVLVLDGPNICVEGPVEVSGALTVRAVPGAKVTLGKVRVANAGWEWQSLQAGEPAKEEEKIRGFRVVKKETRELVFDKPGIYTVSDTPKDPEAAAAADLGVPAPMTPPPPAPPAAAKPGHAPSYAAAAAIPVEDGSDESEQSAASTAGATA